MQHRYLNRNHQTGFTLIEVIIAIAILSISFVLIMQLFSNGLKSARISCDYTRAVVLAKEKMEELSENPVNGSGEIEEGFNWESAVEEYKDMEEHRHRLVKLKVKVSWDDVLRRHNSVELAGLRLISVDENLY